jgi:hypothetical protein
MGIASLHPSFELSPQYRACVAVVDLGLCLQLQREASAGGSGHLGGVFRGSRDIAASREKAGNGDIFVKRFPVQADAAELDLVAFVGRCMEQARKPRERDTECPSIRQFDPHRMFVEANASCRNGHAKPSEEDRGCLPPRAG